MLMRCNVVIAVGVDLHADVEFVTFTLDPNVKNIHHNAALRDEVTNKWARDYSAFRSVRGQQLNCVPCHNSIESTTIVHVCARYQICIVVRGRHRTAGCNVTSVPPIRYLQSVNAGIGIWPGCR